MIVWGGGSRLILLKNSLERLWSSNYKNFGLLDRSRINDRHLGKGSMTPRKAPELANPEFFNRIAAIADIRGESATPRCGNLSHGVFP